MSRKFNYKKNNSSYYSGSNYNKNNNYYYDNNYDNNYNNYNYNYNNNYKKYNSSNYNYRGFSTTYNKNSFEDYYLNNKRKYEENYYEKKNYNEMEIKSEPIQSTFWYNQTITLEQIKEYNSKINKEIPIKELKNFCMNDKENIKLVEKENPININTMLSDISLVPKGIDEEKVYLNNIEYTNIIRRGNTFMETYYKDKYDNWVLDNTFMLRKGMKKFIDIPYKFYLERTTENPYDKFWMKI